MSGGTDVGVKLFQQSLQKYESFKPKYEYAPSWGREEVERYLKAKWMTQLIFFWILYFALHSALASIRIKLWVKTTFPGFFNHYRLTYNIFSIVLLAIVLLFQSTLPSHLITTLPVWTTIIGYIFIGAGFVIVALACKNYDMKEFAGVKPMSEFMPSKTYLKTNGLNAYVRHPIYLGMIFALSGYLSISFDYKTLAFSSIALVYLIIGAKLEERKLILLFGERYIQYKKKVSMLMPKLKKYRHDMNLYLIINFLTIIFF